MRPSFGFKGNAALMVSHCAGMLDLVALPLWIGVLVASYQFDSQQSGGLVTLFLIGAVCASMFVAPRFKKWNRRAIAVGGFLLAALCFFAAAQVQEYSVLAILHLCAGLTSSSALSMAHGTIARSPNPHKLFAIAGFCLGVTGFFFMGATPNITKAVGGHAIFIIFGGIMAIASLICFIAFPSLTKSELSEGNNVGEKTQKIPTGVWFGILAISLMAITQAMTFSFMERVGHDRGFEHQNIVMILVALALINIVAAALAGILEKRLSPRAVLIIGPILQIILANIIMNAEVLPVFAAGSMFFVAIMIFTHTFVFGLLAKLDTSGRALAATPAMLMVGAAIGPILGGTLIKLVGYQGIGVAAAVFGFVSILCFLRVFTSAQTGEVESAV
ncbi:MFS transporter [Marinomonas sp. THO17]|uniref:MFS transporter n=1 Tax=Marinomonas sp. THO17 TaxID=3149048 RepID=UPI00336BEA5A